MKENERLQALKVLMAVITENTPLNQNPAFPFLPPFAKALCFGVCRHFFHLETLALKLMPKRPKDEAIFIIILMGIFQLRYLNKPEYAVLKETVQLAHKIKKTWAKSLINAVLRNFCREKETLSHQDLGFNYPEWLVMRLQNDWPEHWQVILASGDKHPPMSLRVNVQKNTRTEYLQCLKSAGIAAEPHPLSSAGIMLKEAADVNELPGFAEGAVSVQDIAAQLAAKLMDLKPGLHVLDACAAPGGKTCHMLETVPDLKCTALDVDTGRLQRTADNLSRLHLKANIITGDAANPETWWNGQLFDRILLDAPCSATGVVRRHPDIKLIRTEEEIAAVSLIQAKLLDKLWPLLISGGLLVYATCSIMKQENERQVAAFLQRTSGCMLQPVSPGMGHDTGFGWQIFPGESAADGFFYSVLRKI